MGGASEFTGNSFEEAVEKAVEALGVSRESLEIHVVSQKESGFLKWKKQTVVIHAKPKSEVEERRINRTGKAWVQGGRIYFDTSDDNVPVIVPSPGTVLYCNGVEVLKESAMSEGEDWQVEGVQEITETEWDIEISSDKMQAEVFVDPGCVIQREILDTPPSEKLSIRVKETKEVHNSLRIEDLEEAMAVKKINHGLNRQQIEAACCTEKKGYFLVAEGIPPVNGKDGTVAFEVDIYSKRVAPKISEDGKADYRESSYIPTVAVNEVFATVKPPEKGKAGINIFAEEVKALDGKPAVVHALEGVNYDEGKNEITSSVAGRPHADYKGNVVRLSIIPKLEHKGNVDLECGNLQFVGDIIITGNVEDQMKVESEGEVLIGGHITNAMVKAGNLIQIRRNVINSIISAGNPSFFHVELHRQAWIVQKELSPLVKALKQLHHLSGTGNLQTLLSLLLKKKFPKFISKVKAFIFTVEKDKDLIDEEWDVLAKKLYRTFLILHKDGLQHISELEELKQRMERLMNEQRTQSTSHADVTFPYAMNSEILSENDVYVTGKGCSHTVIRAEGTVNVKEVVVGGEIFGGSGIIVGETGSRSGAETLLEVPEGETIQIDKAREGTVLKIGNKKYECPATMRAIYARLDKEAELILQ